MTNEQFKVVYEFLTWLGENDVIGNPAHKRSVHSGLWHALGFNVMQGVPVKIGTNVTYRLGEAEPYEKYRAEWDEKLAEVYGESDGPTVPTEDS